MKPRLAGNVTIPHRPSSIGGLLEWARNVNKCLAELRDRKISGGSNPSRGGGSAATGPFCKTYTSAGEWFLTGGAVTSGTGNVTTGDIALGDTDPVPVDGTYTWLVCTGEAVTEDGLLMPGFNLTSATSDSGLVFPPLNTIPTVGAPTGILHVSLGLWSDGKFIPSACGDVQVLHCFGLLTSKRIV